jgi:hypothetical protein
VVLAAALHVDWHLARPLHHRLSLGWSHHWIATGAVFLIAGCLIARRWPEHRWRMAGTVLLAAAVLAQLVEPTLEVLLYEGRLGYASEPARWTVFWKAISAGSLGLALGILCTRRPLPIRAG